MQEVKDESMNRLIKDLAIDRAKIPHGPLDERWEEEEEEEEEDGDDGDIDVVDTSKLSFRWINWLDMMKRHQMSVTLIWRKDDDMAMKT